MATTAQFDSVSPYSVSLTATGNGGALAFTKTDVYNNSASLGIANGPLLALLRATSDWTVFNVGNPGCDRIQVRKLVCRPVGGEAVAFEFFWTAGGFKLDCNGTCQVEIRLQQSERA